ncbi:hypothetical protein UFOVP613_16 [uncultured Caudovirales phage]|uniref:Uncharacterized protein n=1 Tax=uncultured Caudovirales phage TaxID=2100421 RepID=A0A6J5N1D2_9CAUD|nr:hypothetical protein UFOVP613_16 [uncultured Caudovirales phage]
MRKRELLVITGTLLAATALWWGLAWIAWQGMLYIEALYR